MAKKPEPIVRLAAQTACQITANSGNYMAFLNTAAHNFKYSFRDQLLIFAQKPDATACAQTDFWNEHGRWINRGTTGIALLVDTERGYKLRHVFDMSDTNSREGRTIPIWQMKPQYEGAVIEALENSYGELTGKPDFGECLMAAAKIIVEDKFIGQIMTSKSPVRSAEDIDETALSYAEIKALCTGNPHIKEKMDLDIDVQRLKLLKANHLSQRYALEDQIIKYLPQKIASFEQHIEGYTADMNRLKENTHPNEDGFSPMEVEGTVYTDKKAAGSAILAACKAMTSPNPVPLGQYRGFAMELSFESFSKEYRITLKGALTHTTGLGTDVFGNILRLDNLLGGMEERLIACREQLENVNVQLENAKQEVEKPFPQEDELKTKSARLDELNILLNMDKRESEIVDGDKGDEAGEAPPARDGDQRDR